MPQVTPVQHENMHNLFHMGGETGKVMQQIDWSATSLGHPDDWPTSLKTVVRIMLTSRQPIWVSWGEDMIYMYNDPYIGIVGGRHPWALGQPLMNVWEELKDDIAPLLNKVMQEGEGVYVEDQLFLMERNGYPEETYYTFSYSPIINEENAVGGIICANTEETQRVINERQLHTLQHLSARLSQAQSLSQMYKQGIEALSSNDKDILFASLYLPDEQSGLLKCVAQCNSSDLPSALLPSHVPMHKGGTHPVMAKVARDRQLEIVSLNSSIGDAGTIPSGAWNKPCQKMALLPVEQSGHTDFCGVLVLGLNPYRLANEDYLSFLSLIRGQFEGAIATIKTIEEERERTQALAKLDKAKTQFFSNVSHEFRTPLTLMLSPLEKLLEDENLAPSTKQPLELIQRNGKRLAKLVNSLLDFTRVETGKTKARFEPVALAEFTAHLASHFSDVFSQANIRFTVDCEPLAQAAYIDTAMWEKIVFNLLSNAFKYTLDGEVAIRLHTKHQKILLEVQDTGVGICEQEQSKVFDRFHRVENSAGRSFEGSGIGLALIRELVHLHGGRISLQSTLGKGSCFSVALPMGFRHLPQEHVHHTRTEQLNLQTPAHQAEAFFHWTAPSSYTATNDDRQINTTAPQTTPSTKRPHSKNQEKAKLLVVDDNADMRDYIASIFTEHYQLRTAQNGEEGLNAAQEWLPDVIICDVMMPKLDGFGLLSALRRDLTTSDISLVLLSARAGEEAEIEGLEAGADAYIVKPFSARELHSRIDSLMAMRHLRQAQESYFRSLADNSPAILWTSNKDGQCNYLSQQWHQLIGTTPDAEVKSKHQTATTWLDSTYPEDRPYLAEQFALAIKEHKPAKLRYRVEHQHEGVRWVINAMLPRFNEQGQYLGHVGCIFDVNEQVLAEQELQRADQRKDEFLATLAHELRNPLAPLRNAFEILKHSNEKELHQTSLNLIESQLEYMVCLVNDLMDVSRITHGKIELRKAEVDMGEVLQGVADAVAPNFAKKQQQFTQRFSSQSIYVDGDTTRLSQIFTNILTNAHKYTPEGGKIHLAMSLEQEVCVVTITDNGQGIPQNKLSEIFDMFLQLDDAIGRDQGGLGIGLTLVKQLVDLHGGSIHVESAGLDCGSTFSVRLPTVKASSSAVDSTGGDAAQVAPPNQNTPALSLNILVVDYNEASANTLCQLLSLAGHHCRCEYRGQAALTALDEFTPDVVLLDIGMPEMDGYQVCQQIKQRAELKDVVCIAQTGWGEDKHLQKSKRAGFDYHLVKPVDFAQLSCKLQAVIESKRRNTIR